jgi:competence protein CoiA
MLRVHHFAHKPPVLCSFGLGGSEAHRKCKLSIYDALRKAEGVSDCELEKNLGDCIPDIFASIRNVPVAIEVQISNLTMEEIIRRTEQYNRASISVLWLSLLNGRLDEMKYAPRAWEKWLHATYFGRVYYWLGDSTVLPVHFNDYMLQIEGGTWHDESGDEQCGGGYEKRSLRYRTPQQGKAVDIAKDFRATPRRQWSGGSIEVPSCRLYVDKQPRWWPARSDRS